MKTTLIHREDDALSGVLADILIHLRGRYYGGFHEEFDEDLYRKADGCVERLAGHLRHAEQTILPALRKAGSGRNLEDLETDHRILGLHAHYLAAQIKNRDRAGAYGVARSFLALLLHHVRRETGGAGRCAHALEVLDTDRLRSLIDREAGAAPSWKGPDLIRRN